MVNSSLKSTQDCISVQVLENADFENIRKLLEPVSDLYPDFDTWFNFRVRRQYPQQRIVIAAERDSTIVGVAILKKTIDEHKICTLFVHKNYRGQKVGSELLNEAVNILDGKDISITVSEERNSSLKPLLEKKGFQLKDAKLGYYRPNTTEYFYVLTK
ncbi:GNAT family N-acetyltransferase [Vibrio vulnificus]|uniref:GNAT family N-acetyltransferase n=1 Tax=Vibrio vulnificus TaxID=672 RepID=UPI001CDBBE93|nr:GNAT family N-acetyltransferase [Vibrio vulnificus]MCA3897342.1 GNAT family N-acetyltransferase [Vibrio vulnificus]MCU8462170.1 GNAT family N-acetyltransferase [Vibrio vulnificus]